MNKDILSDVYKDFFGTPYIEPEKNDNNSDLNVDSVDELLISDESKELLKKVFSYMQKYSNKEETRYLNFSFILETDNNELSKNTFNLISDFASGYKYTEEDKFKSISFYDITAENINDIFTNCGLVMLKDIGGMNFNDTNSQKRFFHLIESELSKKKIFILAGTKSEIDYFFQLDSKLRTNYFPFILKGIDPDVNELYNEVLELCSNVDDELSIKILDYISVTYKNRTVSYPEYRDNLCREITFNYKVPELSSKKSMEEIFASLEELVGLNKVKKTLHELVDYMTLKDKNKDLKLSNLNLHMVFLGNPGTGKTTVARIISDILYNLGYIKENKLIEVTSKDLVGEYVGQTAPKTMSVIERAKGGVLFIDEAYTLASDRNQNSYNGEAIATLIKEMEDNRDNLVVIFAGYTKEMQAFLDSNSGIVSRIGYTLEFDDYTEDELVKIFDNMMNKAGFIVSEEAHEELRKVIRDNINNKNFGNARFVRNVYEKTVIKHASNTKNVTGKKALQTIKKNDISCENLK